MGSVVKKNKKVRKRKTRFTRKKVVKKVVKNAKDPVEQYLTSVYTDTKGGGSFGGVQNLLDQIHRETTHKISRKRVVEFLKSRDEYTLHRPANKKFKTEKVIVGAINDYHQADLMVLKAYARQNDGYVYILGVIDCFSRYAWAVPMKTKSPRDVVAALDKVYKNRDTPSILVTDAGAEFTSNLSRKWFKDHDVHYSIAYGNNKAMFIERWIRSFKAILFRYMTYKNTRRYIDKLDDLTQAYNSRYHRSIGMRPIDVNAGNQKELFIRMYGDPAKWHINDEKGLFKEGDHVRISRIKSTFERGFDENYSREIYQIDKVLTTTPITYKLKSLKNEHLMGRFYEQELIGVKIKDDNLYPIEKILKHRVHKGKKQSFVRYVGWSKGADEWVDDVKLKSI